ncbi:MAG: hypothetical protein AB7O52_08595 [Planctomycetota bacterium]
MNTFRAPLLLHLAVVVACTGVALAQESRPRAPVVPKDFPQPAPAVDAKSVELLDRWDSLHYEPPVKQASCDGKATLSGMMAPQPMTGTFVYSWDGKSSEMNFADPALQAKFNQVGLRSAMMDGMFAGSPWREQFANCTLRAVEENGKPVVLVDGKSAQGFTKLVFDERGLPTTIELQAPSMPTPGTATLSYVEIEGKFALGQIVTNLTSPMGPVESRMSYTFTQAGTRHVWQSYKAEVKMGEQLINKIDVEFSNYKFDDEVAGPAKAPAPEPGS